MSEQYEHDLQVDLRAIKIENAKLKGLITELCDALEEEWGGMVNCAPGNLIERAREAAK